MHKKRKSGKDTQYNDQKWTNNDIQNTTHTHKKKKKKKIEEHGPTNLVGKFII